MRNARDIRFNAVIKRLRESHCTNKNTILDIGCNDLTLIKKIHQKFNIPYNHLTGIDIQIKSRIQKINKITLIEDDFLNVVFSSKYDIIIATEVIEHIADTDRFINKCYSLLNKGGILIISTPNLAAWFERILLIFGIQPICTEVSYIGKTYGRRGFYKLFNKSLNVKPAGHLRLFTTRALIDFLESNNFKILKVEGVAHYNMLLNPIFNLVPYLSDGVVISCRKK